MEYLIDTQVVIWSLANSTKISLAVREILQSHVIGISHVSLLEIAIKQKVGKLAEVTITVGELEKQLFNDGFQLVPINSSHISAYHSIPLFPDHRDPLDRLLLATALAENVPIISADEKFLLYPPLVTVIPV